MEVKVKKVKIQNQKYVLLKRKLKPLCNINRLYGILPHFHAAYNLIIALMWASTNPSVMQLLLVALYGVFWY